jgi:hypothetical protein
LKVNRRFGGKCHLHLQGQRISQARRQCKSQMASRVMIKMEICSSEISVNFQRNKQNYVPEDRTLHNCHCENLRSYNYSPVWKVLAVLCGAVCQWSSASWILHHTDNVVKNLNSATGKTILFSQELYFYNYIHFSITLIINGNSYFQDLIRLLSWLSKSNQWDCSILWHCVVWKMGINISEDHTAFTFRLSPWKLRQYALLKLWFPHAILHVNPEDYGRNLNPSFTF